MRLPGLVALTPGDLERANDETLLARLADAVDAGLPGVLVREPRLADAELLELLRTLRERLLPQGSWLAVHDRAHLAPLAGADAVHLGFRSLPPEALRGRFRSALVLGLSTHRGDSPGAWEAADYLFHGPVRPTPSKARWLEAVGFEGLREAVARTDRPVLALGGIRPADVAPALHAGARGVAVLSGILGRERAGEATTAYLAALEAAGGRSA